MPGRSPAHRGSSVLHAVVVPALAIVGAAGPVPAQRPAPPAPVVEIGIEDGDDRYVFGHIADVAVDAAGELLVLDDHLHELRWYDAAGRFRARAGREGRGPGEFGGPRAVAVGSDGRVHVLDPGAARILSFRREEGRLVHERDVRLPVRSIDICILGTRRFVLTPGEPHVIHELDEGGRVVRAFGVPEEPRADDARRVGSAAPLLRMVANQGEIQCDAARGRLYQLHSSAHLVRAFALDGRLLWRAALASPNPQRYEPSRTRPGGIRLSFAGPLSTPADVAVEEDGTLTVTMALGQGGDPTPRYELRRLHAVDGRLLGQGPVPGVVVAVRGGRRYAHAGDPHPRVLIHD